MTRHWHVFESVVFTERLADLTCVNRAEHTEGCFAEINTVVYCYATFIVYNVLVNGVKLLHQTIFPIQHATALPLPFPCINLLCFCVASLFTLLAS